MLKSKSFLAMDLGAGTLKAAEFAPAANGGLKLLGFATKPLGLAGSQDAARENVVKKALGEILAESGFASRRCSVCAPGYQVFSKFVKLPPVDTSKVTQIIQYEAAQNVPFPLAETAWDYQILGTTASKELEVLLVAIKSDLVEKVFAAGEGAGLQMELVDSTIAALANAFRYNYGDLEDCSVLIDLGAKTSNVLLFEKGKFYARSINVGSNAVTQEFAAEAKLPFAEAEKFKIAEGFVSLGGAYEEPDNPKVAAISKVARNVLTRLHLQVNQTIQFYRTQQGGSAPVRVFLCGGGSILPYSTHFFQEKLNLPVEYFNPFRNVEMDPSVNVAELEKVAQCMGETVGLGLRNLAQCPVELNLIPKKSLSRQQFNSKKPYLLGAAAALALGAFATGYYYNRVASEKERAIEEIGQQLSPLEAVDGRLKAEVQKLNTYTNEVGVLSASLREKTRWADILSEMRRVMVDTETDAARDVGRPVGVWVDKLISAEPAAEVADSSGTSDTPKPTAYMMDPRLMARYGLKMPTAAPEATEDSSDKKGAKNSTNEVVVVTATMRAVNLKNYNPNANNMLMFKLQEHLKASPLFDPSETALNGSLTEEDGGHAFKFDVKLKLKEPIKL